MVTHLIANQRLLVKGYARSSRASVAYNGVWRSGLTHAALTRGLRWFESIHASFKVIYMETKICSKCGIEKPVSEYHKNGFDREGKQKYRGYCKACANALESARYYKKKAFIDEQKLCCAKCGDTRTYVLDFHHKDSSTKDFTIGKIKKGSLELIQNEIDKCICHFFIF